jgi:hypothetical protein
MQKLLLIFSAMFVLGGCQILELAMGRPMTLHFIGSATVANPLRPSVDSMLSAASFDGAVETVASHQSVRSLVYTRENFAELNLPVKWLDNLDEIHLFTIINPFASVEIGGQTFNARRPAGFLFKGSVTREQLVNWVSLW